MKFDKKIILGKFIKRYKRFLCDVELEDGQRVTAHCPNTGAMTSCLGDSWPVALSLNENPYRKCAFTLEMTHNGQTWIGVNTLFANKICLEALTHNLLNICEAPFKIKAEVPFETHTRFDFLLNSKDSKILVEVKNTSLLATDGVVMFPDAVSLRAQKHLEMLMQAMKQGFRAVLIFLVQREDAVQFKVASHIDKRYAHLLHQARDSGLEIFALQCRLNCEEIVASHLIPVLWEYD